MPPRGIVVVARRELGGNSQVDIRSGSLRARGQSATWIDGIARVGQLESTPWRERSSLLDIGREFYRLLALKKGSVGNRTRSRSNIDLAAMRARLSLSLSLSLLNNCSLGAGLWSNG